MSAVGVCEKLADEKLLDWVRAVPPSSGCFFLRTELGPGTPRGSRYLVIKELGLKDHDYYGFWDLNPE